MAEGNGNVYKIAVGAVAGLVMAAAAGAAVIDYTITQPLTKTFELQIDSVKEDISDLKNDLYKMEQRLNKQIEMHEILPAHQDAARILSDLNARLKALERDG